MAYTVTGTAGNDTLNQTGDAGPGTIVGLAGNDEIRTGTGAVTVDGGSGEDTTILQAGNTGQVTGGVENDSIWDANTNVGSMVLFGNEGADTINVDNSTNPQTILGGNDSADGNDSIRGGAAADIIFGHGGDDRISAGNGNDTYVAGFGNDFMFDPGAGGNDLVFANEGNNSMNVWGGNDTVFAGQGNDSAEVGGGMPIYFMNEGNDTFDGSTNVQAMTVVGGNDSNDGSDSILTGTGDDLVFGNGGNDTLLVGTGSNTAIGGAGDDSIYSPAGSGNDLVFGNEGNDTINTYPGSDTVFAGQGNDSVLGNAGTQSYLGGEGNDTLRGGDAIDTISGGSGADVFAYVAAADDGNNANAGGPIEQLTDVNFDEDRFQVFEGIEFAANVGAVAGPNLEASAEFGDPGGGCARRRRCDRRRGAVQLQRPHLPGDQPGRQQRPVHRYVRPSVRHHRCDGYHWRG